ncbi:MAG: hypothetical protein KJ069_23100 [Anaerolineae bacterium]|nr:hypothetical protein [Anaerolineae bacterium]
MKPIWRITTLLTSLLLVVLLLAACTNPGEPQPPGCISHGIGIIPTATRQTDPDLFSPPTPPDGGDDTTACPTPILVDIVPETFPEQFVTTAVVNLSLDITNQDLAATAVGDDMLAVAWLSESDGITDIFVALSRGGNHFQVRQLDSGSSVSLAFSRANRLHVVYEQDGRTLYRAADQGTHPADVEPIFVAHGRTPQVVVDELNWAHVLYEQDGRIFKAKHLSGDAWLAQYVTDGSIAGVAPFYNDQGANIFGIPSDAYWFGLFLAVTDDSQIRLLRYLSWFNLWQQTAVIPLPPDEQLTGHFDGLSAGSVGLDYLAVSEEEAWVYAAWVTKRPFPEPPLPHYVQPSFEAANPLYPDQIANPNHIYTGLNAVRWRSQDTPFDAGLRQTISVPDPNGTITFEAWGLVDTAAGADLTLRIGIDPTGGDNPNGPDVVWSEAAASPVFTPLSITVAAQGSSVATVFLRGTLDTAAVPGTAVWDSAVIHPLAGSGSALVNGDFEGPFISQDSITVPEGWTAWYQDSGNTLPGGRDVTTVYAAWSDNGGFSWTGPEAITANHDSSGSTTGAIRPDVYPIISTATEPPSVNFFYIYETGDPPPGTTFLRFGRPYLTMCDLGTAVCTDTSGTPPSTTGSGRALSGQALLPRHVIRPSYRLLAARDPFNLNRAILTWDSLQTDAAYKDVHATYLVLR